MMGGMADIGYLIFIEFVGYVNVFPRTLMTLVPASAIILVLWVWIGSHAELAQKVPVPSYNDRASSSDIRSRPRSLSLLRQMS